MFEIKVSSKDGKWQDSVRCGADSCAIGRSRDVILRVRGWKVAPKHVRFEKELAGVFVVDISRGAGVTVNGQEVERYGPLEPDDEIGFGGFVATVVDHSPDAGADGSLADLEDKPAASLAEEFQGMDQGAQHQRRDDYMEWAKFAHRELM